MFRAPVYLYRWHLGGLLGHRFLLLSHTGRRTGLRRQTVLEVIRYLPCRPEAVVMSGFGPKSDWLQNIEANGDEEIFYRVEALQGMPSLSFWERS